MKRYERIPIGSLVRFTGDQCEALPIEDPEKYSRFFPGRHRTAILRPNPILEGRITKVTDLHNRTRPISYRVEVEMLRGPNGSLWSEISITSEEIIEVVEYHKEEQRS